VASHSATTYQQGLIIGKFAPLTLGHINLINHASTLCEHVLVLLSFDSKWLMKQPRRDQQLLTLQNRLRWLKQAYQDIAHVKIDFIDESSLAPHPEGWPDFVNLVHQKIESMGLKPDAIFSSELHYDEAYAKYFSSMQHIVVDAERTYVPVSASKIRSDVIAYWGYLPSVVRQDYVKKVCIIGTESCGKSTMTKYLAKIFNTSWVEEYGRVYCETVLCQDEFLLTSNDYLKIAIHQKYLEEQAAKTANNGVLFCDTNAFITEFYHRLHGNGSHSVVSAMAHNEHYDLIFILTDSVPWVADGLRAHGSDEKRQRSRQLFTDMLKEFHYDARRVVWISESNYSDRLKLATSEVHQLLKSSDA
jgi:HTH-type transcriptional repressor of NAD biosynthesis genes